MAGIDTISYEEFSKRDKIVTDFTVDGECSNCGGCCTNFLPMTLNEFKVIKRFIHNHGIKDGYLPNYLIKNETINLVCPFRNQDTRQCNIYEVRPEICRVFMCNLKQSDVLAFSIEIRRRGNKSRLVQARQEFYCHNKQTTGGNPHD